MSFQHHVVVEELERCRIAKRDGDSAEDAVMELAGRMPRIFQLPVPDAEKLVLVGGQVDGTTVNQAQERNQAASVTGAGFDLWSAAMSCVCEAAEFLSQLAVNGREFQGSGCDDARHRLDDQELATLLAMAGHEAKDSGGSIPWVEGQSIGGDIPVLLPAELCYRNIRQAGLARPRVKLSTGCGAGTRREAALLHALLELIERDAVALWWLGGRRGRSLPIDKGVDELLAPFGREKSSRRCWLLDITTDLAVPCVAALSTDEHGRAFACGFAARLDHERAVTAAVREMCQMEVGLYLVLLKRGQDGDAALSKADKLHLMRAFGFDVLGNPLLLPDGAPRADRALLASDTSSAHELWTGLGGDAGNAYWVDLTRPDLRIPAVRVLAPVLQPYPSDVCTARLQRQIARSGGGLGLTSGTSLM